MTPNTSTAPLLDLRAPEAETRKALAAACADWGFFQVTHHGISGGLLQATLDVSRRFFARPLPDKQALSRTRDQPWGYYDRELTKNLRDRKEIFDFGHTGPVPWPDADPEFRDVSREFSAAAHALGMEISARIARAFGLPTEPVRRLGEQHGSFTRLNHYPLQDPLAHSDAPPPGPLGISRHTDAGVLTVLLQDAVSGLQMQREGTWIDVPPRPGTLTVNVGDMFQVWSNDRIAAPVHRVLASAAQERYSIAYFLNPGEESVIEPLLPAQGGEQARYEPIRWAEFRGQRALGDYANYGEEVQISHYRREG